MRSQSIPTYRRQPGESHDRASVCLNGHRHYLGKYGSPESKEAYRRLIAEWAIRPFGCVGTFRSCIEAYRS